MCRVSIHGLERGCMRALYGIFVYNSYIYPLPWYLRECYMRHVYIDRYNERISHTDRDTDMDQYV